MKRWMIVGLCMAVVSGGLYGCQKKTEEEQKEPSAAEQARDHITGRKAINQGKRAAKKIDAVNKKREDQMQDLEDM